MWSHWSRGVLITVVAGALCVGVVATVSGVTRSGKSKATPTDRALAAADAARDAAANRSSRARALAAAVQIAPASGATQVAPDASVLVAAASGRLATVRVTSTTGAAVAGQIAPSGSRWESTGSLAYGATYHVFVTATDSPNARAELTSTFRTLTPGASVGATVFPSDGLSVGVGQPIVFHFDHPISGAAAQSAVLSHLVVTESQPVLGGWHWFSDEELHFRPQTYWPANDRVTVAWNLQGWNAGNGMWGLGEGVVHFAVGDARVSFANLATHLMTVTDNGRVVATYPISGGKPTDPTMDGVHIVLDRSTVVRMQSSTNGVPNNAPDGYDELVYFDVHISDSGEYVHAAPWSVSSQGHQNVSHGCINLSPDNAQAFFGFSHVGDVVLVGGSPRPPSVGDHGVMDWDTAWNQYAPANAILRVPASLSVMH